MGGGGGGGGQAQSLDIGWAMLEIEDGVYVHGMPTLHFMTT